MLNLFLLSGRYLVESGADIESKGNLGGTAIIYAAFKGLTPGSTVFLTF